jgi:carbamoyl-phosphate synthase small subunit
MNQNTPLKDAVLLLDDGTIFRGKAAGKIGTTTGEICFNTGMTGYQEIFTDPSYSGQIMVTATVHIGNYGVSSEEVESGHMKIAGLVCKKFSVDYSRKKGDSSVGNYFENESVVGISDVDTRAIVAHIRDKGAMNAIISSETDDIELLKKQLAAVPSMEGLELSSTVSTQDGYYEGDPNSKYKVALLDLGVKRNIVRSLTNRGCYVRVFPWNATFEEMAAWNPSGYLISNGPGDPATLTGVVAEVKKAVDADVPLFGICLGHQILAQSAGLNTYKMHSGHRGINHPVKNLITGKCEVTSQNHGFAVSPKDVENATNVEVTHINLNDDTIEGIRIKGKKAFSVQYHPEASPGPHDSRYLFDDFVKMLG